MAAGEYVSVSSQSDVERADLALERRELADDPTGELAELTGIYVARGLTPTSRARSPNSSPHTTPSAPTAATSWACPR